MSGLFIVFEGGDGVGKSTQLELLASKIQNLGHEVVSTREPGGTDLGATIRNLLLHGDDHIDARAEALLYAADRAQHISTVVLPALERGAVVLQDRYIDSSLSYQGAGRILSKNEVLEINQWASRGLLPDLTVLLDLDPQAATERQTKRGAEKDRLESESLDFHSAVRQEFINLAQQEPHRYLVCDATEKITEISSRITEAVMQKIQQKLNHNPS